MILEIDCGNTSVKWRIINANNVSYVNGIAFSKEELFSDLRIHKKLNIPYSRMVSVISKDKTEDISKWITKTFDTEVLFARSARCLAGVKNGYDNFQKLGLDRWLAITAAFSLSRKACLVIDLGTAITSDFISRVGEHIGGFICPGVSLMTKELKKSTHGVDEQLDLPEDQNNIYIPATQTMEAVGRGCSLMLRGFISEQILLANSYWKDEYVIFLTGGNAGLVSETKVKVHIVKDLVFIGLAISCPIPP